MFVCSGNAIKTIGICDYVIGRFELIMPYIGRTITMTFNL